MTRSPSRLLRLLAVVGAVLTLAATLATTPLAAQDSTCTTVIPRSSGQDAKDDFPADCGREFQETTAYSCDWVTGGFVCTGPGTSTNNQPTNNQPANNQPTNNEPTNNQPVTDGTCTTVTPRSNGQDAKDDFPADCGGPFLETMAYSCNWVTGGFVCTGPGTSTNNQPTNNQPVNNQPTNNQPTNNQPNQGLTWGYDTTQPDSSRNRPGFFQQNNDSAYGTPVTRVSSADGTRFNRNTYSRRQAENINGSLFLTYHGSAQYRVYNTSNGNLVQSLNIHPDSEPQWHATNPDVIWHLTGNDARSGSLRLLSTNVRNGSTSTVADLTNDLRARFGNSAQYISDQGEGGPSLNGRRYAWFVYDGSGGLLGLVSYEVQSDGTGGEILGALDASEFRAQTASDDISMSPSGNYVVAQVGGRTERFNANLGDRRFIFNGAEHADIARDVGGRDAYVYIDYKADKAGYLVTVDLATMQSERIFEIFDADADTSMHISGKGYNKPGWVVVSTYNCRDEGAWTCDKVFAVELEPGGRVLNLAHTYNCRSGFFSETHAVVNRSFTRVYFNSNNLACGSDRVEVYRIDVPAFN